MTDANQTENLGSLFESITGETSVVDRQETDPTGRAVEDRPDDEAVDTIEHHGLSGALDGAETADPAA